MLLISVTPQFKKMFSKLENSLQDEALEKIDTFKSPDNHQQLKVHKLHGKYQDCHSFSVNYKIRIVFQYLSSTEIVLTAIGDHSIYK